MTRYILEVIHESEGKQLDLQTDFEPFPEYRVGGRWIESDYADLWVRRVSVDYFADELGAGVKTTVVVGSQLKLPTRAILTPSRNRNRYVGRWHKA